MTNLRRNCATPLTEVFCRESNACKNGAAKSRNNQY
jgi:hypothetical protein